MTKINTPITVLTKKVRWENSEIEIVYCNKKGINFSYRGYIFMETNLSSYVSQIDSNALHIFCYSILRQKRMQHCKWHSKWCFLKYFLLLNLHKLSYISTKFFFKFRFLFHKTINICLFSSKFRFLLIFSFSFANFFNASNFQ